MMYSQMMTMALEDAFEDPIENGIFNYLTDFDWNPDDDTHFALNSEYFYNRSGRKLASPLVIRLAGDSQTLVTSAMERLARVIMARYSLRWNKLWDELISTIGLTSNINLTTTIEYGKTSTLSGSDAITKSGTETRGYTGDEQRDETFPEERKTTRQITGGWKDEHGITNTRTGSEAVEESFPTARKSSKEVSGGWKDTDTTATTRTGTETSTESFPTPRSSTKGVSGGWKDTDTTATTRTGSEKTTDKGDTQTSTYGFNSTTSVPASISGPADSTNGLTSETSYTNLKDTRSGDISRSYQSYSETTTESGSTKRETTFGESGLKDTRSGDISRSYQSYKEDTTETGSKRIETTYGQSGLVDAESGDTTRTYDSYKDEVSESGSKRIKTSFNNRKDELSFNDRSDTTTYGKTDTQSGNDVTIQSGMNLRRLTDKIDVLKILYTSPEINNFFEVVYSDIDEVLTCPIFV